MTDDERASLRHELIGIYFTIARDSAQHPALRMQAASHLLEHVDNPFCDLSTTAD